MSNSFFKIALILLFTFFQSVVLAQSPQTIKKKKSYSNYQEEFFVLRDNKDIKQGQYLKWYKNMLEQEFAIEFGGFESNLKSGTWFFFYSDDYNSLKSTGDFSAGQKVGNWSHYYPIAQEKQSISGMFGSEKRTTIVHPNKELKEIQIGLDTTGLKLASFGNFQNGKKSGVWKYFSKNGSLIHSFDHTTNQFINSSPTDIDNNFLVYLGGQESFFFFYYSGLKEVKPIIDLTDSEAVFEIKDDGSYEFVQGKGDERLKGYIQEVLNLIPNQWTLLSAHSSKLQIISKFSTNDSVNRKRGFFFEFRVVKI